MPTWILKFFGALGKFLSVLFKGAINEELKVVLPIAAGAVRSVAKDPTLIAAGSKRDTAVELILAELAAAQVKVGISVINLAIELAVQEFKATDVTQAAPAGKGE